MLQNFGTALSREQMKNVKGGDEQTLKFGDGATCLTDYTYDCAANSDCCSNKCERNGTNTGTLCMP